VKNLQGSYQSDLDRMVQELNAQAHFVGYAPPAFVPFHKGLYLQLSVTTTLPKTAAVPSTGCPRWPSISTSHISFVRYSSTSKAMKILTE